MNLTVITDRNGRVLGTIHAGKAARDAPTMVGVIPLEGQVVHTVDVPEKLVKTGALQQLHATHYIDLTGTTAILREYR
jgi:hypothetical protein